MNFFSAPKTSTCVVARSATLLSQSQNLLHLLQLSVAEHSLILTQQCHARMLSLGFAQNPLLSTKLISAYATCGAPNESRLVFDSLQLKSVYLCNSLINGYAKNHAYSDALGLFQRMWFLGVAADDYTLATILKVCSEATDLDAGKLVHGRCVRTGFVFDVVVANSLMSMYCKSGEFSESLKVFDQMPHRNVSSWNVVIAGHVDTGDRYCGKQIFDFIKDMQLDGLKPDAFTVSTLLPLCSEDVEKLDYGRQLHGYAVRNKLGLGFGLDFHLGCCLIDFYSRIKRVVLGRRVFNQIDSRNVYTWTAMINGYVKNGALEEGLVLFDEMQRKDRVRPSRVSLVSILPACSSVTGLNGVKQIHGYAIRREWNIDVSLSNALIDMYSKCGSLNYAIRVFEDESVSGDAISWSSMMSGYGLHGKGEEATCLYHKMLQLGNKPDTIALVGVLSACGRSGLVDEGLQIYNSAINEYGIKPTVEICACVADMLGRSGQLSQALEFIKTMPMEPGPSVWGALVSASIVHGNPEIQDLAYRFLIQLEPENPSNYISLSNLHASSKKWDTVAQVRTMMKQRGLTKTPGCSWISINGIKHSFYAYDKLHPNSESIYEMLDGLLLSMKGAARSLDSEKMK